MSVASATGDDAILVSTKSNGISLLVFPFFLLNFLLNRLLNIIWTSRNIYLISCRNGC